MDNLAMEEGPATAEAAAGQIQHQERPRSRRRMVQSTLIPHKFPTIESKGDQKSDKEWNGEDKDVNEDECCGSQGKKTRTRKLKGSPQTKSPKKAKEASAETSSEKDTAPEKSPSSMKGASKKNGTPRKSATPKRNGITNGKIASHLVENGDTLPPIPNLRLEAKMMAEENSRVFAGKQIHPFFLSKNMGSRCHDKTNQIKPKSITLSPIHVFEREQDAVTLDWINWNFHEESFIKSSYRSESAFSSIFECTVKSLGFDKFSSWLHPSGSSLHQDNMSLDASQQEHLHEASVTAMSSDVHVKCHQLVKDAKTDYQVDEVGLVTGILRKSDEQQGKFLQERFMSSHLGCSNQLDNRLWIDKYQPKKAAEICGNDGSVKFLNEWLHTWSQRGQPAEKEPSEYDARDPDYNSFPYDSDSENISEETNLKNVLLITGPVGSGKSAAVYACAKEQGFRVLEANTSECRNGAVIKERFGVLASQSTLDLQLHQRSQESSIEFQSMNVTKSFATLPNGKMLQQLGTEVTDAIPISDEDISCGATETSEKFVCKENSVVFDQGQIKPLILFEDVDIIFSEDRGFVSAIQQIADKVKGPVVLTSNSDKPFLSDNLDRLEVVFEMPLDKELRQHVYMVCAAEKINVQPQAVEQLINFCDRDIRKTIMHLQFWYQGEQFRKGKDGEVQRLSSLLPFDLEAGYQILPKLIPWDFPSQLSELVEKEITMSSSMMEESSIYMDVTEDKFDNEIMQDSLKKCIYETDSIEAKKKAMLSKNVSVHDCIDFYGSYDTCDLFDFPSSPVPFSGRSSRRNLVVMSSDSEDELVKDRVPETPDKDVSYKLFLEVDSGLPSHHPFLQKGLSASTDLLLCSGAEKLEENLYQCSQTATELRKQKCSNPSTELQLCSGSKKLEENIYQCSETAIPMNEEDTSISVDVSCVPESSFVPETVINDGTKLLFSRFSCGEVGQMAEIFEEASVSNEFRQTLLHVEADNLDKSMTELHKDYNLVGGTCDVISVLPHEEAEDSQYGLGKSIMREPQLMDECSCIDFSRFELHGKCRSSTIIDTVRKSWRKLRDRRADLKHFVASEHKSSSGIIELACGISNLLSEVELLHTKCQSLDSLGLPIIFSEESNAFSWCNEQLQMVSTILQHGFWLYAKDIASAGLNMDSESSVDLIWDMLSSTSKAKVGVSLGQNIDSEASRTGLPENGLLPNSERKLHFINIIRSMVPSRAYMSIKGHALCEYLSSLGHISRSESSRISEGVDKTKRRRGRAARNYLSTGSMMLSPEEISLLGQSNIYGKITSQSIDTNIR